MAWITENWKTTLTGVAVFIIGGLVYTGMLDDNTAIALIAFISGSGHVMSGDAKSK